MKTIDEVRNGKYDHMPLGSIKAPVAQLDRVLASEAKGQRFDSSRARQFSLVA